MTSANTSRRKVNDMADTKKVIQKDAFGVCYDPSQCGGIDCNQRFVDELGLDLDKETGSTSVVVKGKIDLQEQIEADRDNVGIDAMFRLVAQGRANIAQFADDGQHGGDFTRPTMLAEVGPYMEADSKSRAELKAIAESLGVSVDDLLNPHTDIQDLLRQKLQKQGSGEPQKGESK